MTPMAATQAGNTRGSLLLIMALALFTVEITLIKLLSDDHAIVQLVLWRSASQLVVMLPLMLRQRGRIFRTDVPWLHLARGGLSGVGMFGFFYAFSVLPLAFATAISFTQPVFLVLLAILVAAYLGSLLFLRRLTLPRPRQRILERTT